MVHISKLLGCLMLSIGLLVAEGSAAADTHQRVRPGTGTPSQPSGRPGFMAEGRAAQLIADYPKALAEYEDGLKRAQASGNKKAMAGFLSQIGTVHRDLGNYDKAMQYLEQALAIHRELGHRHGEGWDLTRIGSVYQHLGQYDKAFQVCEQVMTIAKNTNNRMLEGNTLTAMGLLYRQTGQNQKALEHHNRALPLDRETNFRRGEASTLSSMGDAYGLLGEYEKALQLLEQSLTIRRELNDRRGIATCLGTLGSVYRRLGQGRKALEYHQQALDIRREINDRRGEAASLNSIGNLYANSRQNEKALQCLEQTLAIVREIKDRRGEGDALNNMGIAYYNLGQYDKALQVLQQALVIAKEINDPRGQGSDLTMMGYCYRDSGRQEPGRQAFSQAVKVLAESDTPEYSWRALRGLGSVEARLGRHDEAVSQYSQALDTIEAIRGELSEEQVKIRFMQSKLNIYDEFIILLQTLHGKYPNKGYDRKSLEIFERRQGRIFLEEVGKSGARNFTGLPESVRAREGDLEDRFAQLQANLAEERSMAGRGQHAATIRSLEQKLAQVKTDQESIRSEIRTSYPDYYALKYPQPVTLSELQERVLKPGEAMLVYATFENTTCLWAISKDTFKLFSIGIGQQQIESKVNTFRKGFETVLEAIPRNKTKDSFSRLLESSLRDLEQNGRELYGVLIPEGAQKIISSNSTLYIVPTGQLYALPFEALFTPAKAGAKGPVYLVESHSVAYLSSASLLKVLRDAKVRRKGEAQYPLLAFANPVYAGMKSSPPKANPVRSANPDAISSPETSSEITDLRAHNYMQLMGGSFPELPETEDEAKEIKSILAASDASQPLQLREAASRSNVLRFSRENKLNQYRYLVFACHGVLPGEVDFVTQPALVLSHPDPSSQRGGFLTMADVLGLQLNANLVTLSACNTGRGKLQRAEGVIGLTRAFMFAGSQAVSVTLWSVESNSAKVINTGVYKQLKSGTNLANSLRAAKLRMIHHEEGEYYHHPFFWASMVMMGDVS